MRKLKPSVKAALASTLVLTSTAAIAYAVPGMLNEKNTDIGNKLKLDVQRVDNDTVKVAIDNIKDIPKSLQFSIKLEGVQLKEGEKSIKDLVEKEVQTRLKNNQYSTKTNSVLTDYTYNQDENTIDVLITSGDSLPKVANKVEIFELDVKKTSKNNSETYKVLPNKENEYKYVSNTNKEYSGLGVAHDNKDIAMASVPTIKSKEQSISIVENEVLTAEKLTEKLDIELKDEDNTQDLKLEILENGKIVEDFKKNTPGIYELEIKAVNKKNNLKSEAIKIQVNVVLEKITEPPTITMDGKELADITLDGGSVFNPLANVKAVDKKGRDVKVSVKSDKELDLDPDKDTTYKLTYTATDIYGNKAEEVITLTVSANQAPVISGVKDHIIQVGDNFSPEDGVTVKDDKDINIELKVDSDVNTKIPGTYKVSYSATDSGGKTSRVQSTVKVNPKPGTINKVPVITASDKTIKPGDQFDPLKDVTAYDEEDKDLTKYIKVVKNDVDSSKVGTYKVVYEVTDSEGATTTKVITVTVKSDIVLADSITINNKSDNKVYVGGSKTITASVNESADLKDIDWKISDPSIAELRIVRNEARIIAKAKGEVNLTASTIDGSNKSDTMTINVSSFEEDNEVPSYVKDVIDTNVLTPMSGSGVEESPLEFEVKDVTANKLDKFLDDLKSLDYKVLSISEDDDFTVYKIKVVNKSGLFRLFKSTEDTYINIKVSKSLDNADEINDRLAKLSDNGTQKPENKKPTISIDGLNTNIMVGDTFNPLDGVVAFDDEDGYITDSIEVSGKVNTTKPGTYTLKYTVKDSQGEETSITVDIIVSEKTETNEVAKGEKPVIKVTSSIDTITVGDKFDPLAGVSAYDKEDGDLTGSIKVSGSVDTSKAGKYKLTYTVEDKDGNIYTLVRTITVVEKTTSKEENKGSVSSPQTGDAGMIGYIGIAVAAVGGLVLNKKRKK